MMRSKAGKVNVLLIYINSCRVNRAQRVCVIMTGMDAVITFPFKIHSSLKENKNTNTTPCGK